MGHEQPSWDVQDARDRELLARGAFEEVLACYVPLVTARCRNRCGAHGDDAAQHVFLRLWRELSSGKHRGDTRPFREVVNGIVYFACKGWEGTVLLRDAPLEEWALEDEVHGTMGIEGDILTRIDFDSFVASLPAGDREIARMRFIDLLEIDQISQRLGSTRNAVDQALYRIRREWKQWLET